MLQLLEFVPIVLFFIVYQLDGQTIELLGFSHQVDGIFSATAVLIVATVIQVLITWAVKGTLEKKLLWLMAAAVIFGGATLVLKNQLFIQWKPTIVNWTFALICIGSMIIGEKNIMERMLGGELKLPKPAWTRLIQIWAGYFFIVGAANLFVAYNFSEATWVSYKLYSFIGFTLALILVTIIFMYPFLKEQAELEESAQRGDSQ